VIQSAVAAFVGAFAALVALAEIQSANKLLRYVGAFLVGVLLTVVLSWLLSWASGVFAGLR
jgi:hypothetical protein